MSRRTPNRHIALVGLGLMLLSSTGAAPALAQDEPQPQMGIGTALKVFIAVVPATDKQLTLKRAGVLLRHGLQAHGYKNLGVARCRHSGPRAVSCGIEADSWSGQGAVQLRPHHVARITYTLEG